MTRSVSATRRSLMLTTGSFLLGLISIGVGRRVNYIDYLPVFNLLALTMLVLVVAALVMAIVGLARTRGKGVVPWLAATSAALVMAAYLLDD